CSGALQKQRCRVFEVERAEHQRVLARYAQELTCRYEKARLGCALCPVHQRLARVVRYLLEIVQNDQALTALGDDSAQLRQRLGAAYGTVETTRNGGGDAVAGGGG